MAFTKTPTGYFAGWAEDATDITVPIASFPLLTAALADGATGDIRAILYAILDQAFTKWATLPEADRSQKMVLRKDSRTDTVSGVTTHTYTAVFKTSGAGQAVVAE